MALATKHKKTNEIHHKKRHGLHQKRTQRFVKTYWPYIPMLAIVGFGLFINGLWSSLGHDGVLGYATNVEVQALLEDTNTQRMTNGQQPLHLNDQLNIAAQAKAVDMVTKDYWSHVTPDGRQPWTFVSAAGYRYIAAGENLAYGFGTSNDAIVAWMNSPEHRANLLNNAYQDVGFGFANSSNYQQHGPETIIVAFYGEAVGNTVAAAALAPLQSGSSAGLQSIDLPTTLAVTTNTPDFSSSNNQQVPPKNISRIQLLTAGKAPWSFVILSSFISAALCLFIVKHVRQWQRFIMKGELFLVRHAALDIVLVFVLVFGYIATRSAGFIR